MTTVAFATLGCKVNFYDTEGIWQVFKAAGYEQVDFEQKADVYVINTCTVTHTGDKKSRQMIRRAIRTNPDAVVAVTGCYAQVAPEKVAAIAGVDLVVGNDRKSEITQMVEEIRLEQHPYQAVGNILKSRSFEEFDVPYFEDRTRANLKIQDGCNNFCTFCIIPYARGLIRSRKPENILSQARKLAAAGYREIVLTGIHTGGYGADLGGYRLANLLRDLESIEDLYRVRISSIEASEIDDELIEVLGQSTKVCNHLHIPLQAGHNQVLRRMNRHYTVEDYANKLTRLRGALPDLAVTSDVIVGFPGETDAYFDDTVDFITHQRFSQLHVFPYSTRSGTPAARFTDTVPEDVKEARVRRLIALSERLTVQYATNLAGHTLEVIPEEVVEASELWSAGAKPYALAVDAAGAKQWFVGHAANYLRVAFPVQPCHEHQQVLGEVQLVRLAEPDARYQQGQWLQSLTHPVLEDTQPAILLNAEGM